MASPVNSTPLSGSNTASGVTRFAKISCDQKTAKKLADVLSEAFETASVAAFEGTDGNWHVEFYADGALDEKSIHALVKDVGGDVLARALTLEEVAQRDWVAASLEGLKPVDAGRFLVHGSHDRAKAKNARIPIEIEAALAFGTGHHGTTRGCLLAFDRILRARRPQHVLDVGTGTGVLAIAAARMSHRRVVASDIDKVAVRVAIENAQLNRVAPLFCGIHARGVDAYPIRRSGPYGLIFANILLPPLKRLARPIARLLAPHGRVVLSGLLPEHANAAISAYRAQGLSLERHFVLDGWATLTLRRGA
jgi:ribosomal protein L11 methyltransferase